MNSIDEIEVANLNNLVEKNMAFIIKTVSDVTGRYVSIENDDEFSIALTAFAEAVGRFNKERGAFLGFAKLVIESRLKTYFAKINKMPKSASLEVLNEQGIEFEDLSVKRADDEFIIEIDAYKKQLEHFGLNLEILADTAPKHKDTRERALGIAETVSENDDAVKLTYKKKRLPIKMVATVAKVTEKIVKVSKNFILAAMIIFVKRYPVLYKWIAKAEV